MGDRTGIEWTEATWNPWHGCRKVSPGCQHCYMYRDKRRFGQDPAVVVRASDSTFRAPLRWREAKRIFTCSWSDFFIREADWWRDEAWQIIEETPRHTYQILTKRPERVANRLPWKSDPWKHVWILISAEDQQHFDARWPFLREAPVALRGVSAEPLLGPLDLGSAVESGLLSWVIVGGESGPGARSMRDKWVRDLRDQCARAGVAFFFKQWGGVMKKRAGRLLDGRTWDELPTPSADAPSLPSGVVRA